MRNLEDPKDGLDHYGGEIGPKLLFVVLIALHVMRQAGPGIVRRRAQRLTPCGDWRGNRNVLLRLPIRNAGANGGNHVVREEHRRQK